MKFSAAIAALFMASEAAAFVPVASRAAVRSSSVRYSAVAEPENAEKAKVPAGLEKELNSLEKEIEAVNGDEKAEQAKEVSASLEKKAEESVKVFVPAPSAPSISEWDRIEP